MPCVRVSTLKPNRLSCSRADPSASSLISHPLGSALPPLPLYSSDPPLASILPLALALPVGSAPLLCVLASSTFHVSSELWLHFPLNAGNSLLPHYVTWQLSIFLITLILDTSACFPRKTYFIAQRPSRGRMGE